MTRRARLLAALALLLGWHCTGCGAEPVFAACGAVVYDCSDSQLTYDGAQAAIGAVGYEMHRRGLLPSANVCQFAGELEFYCDGSRGPVLAHYEPWPLLNIKLHNPGDTCRAAADLSHELIHWAADRLLGMPAGHYEPFFDDWPAMLVPEPYTDTVEAHAASMLVMTLDDCEEYR